MSRTRGKSRRRNPLVVAAAHAVAHGAALALTWPALAGISFVGGSSTVKFSHDADKSDSDPTAKTYTLISVPSEGSMGSSFQFNKPITTGSSLSEGTGLIGHVTDSTAAAFELGAGTGVAQDDSGNVWGGSSSLKLTVDMLWNVTSGGWGSTAAAQAALALGGQVGANGGYVQFIPNLRWYKGSGTGTPISDTWNTTRQWTNNTGSNTTFASTVSFFSPFYNPSYSNGDQIHLYGTIEFRSSNFNAPSQILPTFFEFGGGAPLRTFVGQEARADFSDPKFWVDGVVPGLDDSGGERAKLVNLNLDPFGNPGQQPSRKTITIDRPITLIGMDLDGDAGFDFNPLVLPGGPSPRITFRGHTGGVNNVTAPPVLRIKNIHGNANHTFQAGINLAHTLDLQVDSVVNSPVALIPAVQFGGQISGEGGLRKLGLGVAALNFGNGEVFNNFTGGVAVESGILQANAFRSLGVGAVNVNGGVLGYNVTDAAAGLVTVKSGGQLTFGSNFFPGGNDSFAMEAYSILEGTTSQINELIERGSQRLLLPANVMIAPIDTTGQLNLPQDRKFLLGYRFNSSVEREFGSEASNYSGFGITRSNVALGGTVVLNGAADVLVPQGGNLNLTAQINEAPPIFTTNSLTKRGGGTLLIANPNNNFTGPLSIVEGTVLLSKGGRVGGNVTVGKFATFGGEGIAGSSSKNTVLVQPDGMLAPGQGIGQLQMTRLNLNAGSKLLIELRSPTVGDFINVTTSGGLLLPASGFATIDISDPQFSPTPGNYPLIDYAGTHTGVVGTNLRLAGIPTDEFNFVLRDGSFPGTSNSMIFLEVTAADGPQWKINGGGPWTSAANWIGDVPGQGFGDEANFLGKLLDGPAMVDMEGSKTVGVIELAASANPNPAGDSYVIRQTNAADMLTLDNGLSPAAIDVALGNHLINAPVTFASNGLIETAAETRLAIGQKLMVNDGKLLTKSGAGRLNLNSTTELGIGSTFAIHGGVVEADDDITGGAITIEQATLRAMRLSNTTLQVNAGGTARVRPDGTPAATSVLKDVNIATDAKLVPVGELDLSDNNLIVKGTAANAFERFQKVREYVRNGFAGGDWNGMGINSGAAANDPLRITGLAVRRNAINTVGRIVEPLFDEFDGHSVTEYDTLVVHTYYGDTDLNGLVDVDDYHRVDQWFLRGGSGWERGDFNYSDTVDLEDYALMDAAFVGQGGSLAAPAGPASAAAVPEPGAAAVMALGALSFMARRRRRK